MSERLVETVSPLHDITSDISELNNVLTVEKPPSTDSKLFTGTTPTVTKFRGRLPKALTFTRERAGSTSCIEDFLKRKRPEDTDLDNSTYELEDSFQQSKKMNKGPPQSPSSLSEAAKTMNQTQEDHFSTTDELSLNLDLETPDSSLPVSAATIFNMFNNLSKQMSKNTCQIENQIKISQRSNEAAIEQVKKDLTNQLGNIRARQDKLEAEIEDIKSGKLSHTLIQNIAPELTETQAKIKQLEDMLHQQEKHAKKLNVVVKNHSWAEQSLMADACKFIEMNFNLSNVIESVSPSNRDRKIARVKFSNIDAKESVMSSKARVLKNTSISINHDLTKRALFCNKKIQEKAMELRNEGKPVKVKGNRLLLENKWYSWDLNYETIRPAVNKNPPGVKSHRTQRPQKNN